MWFSPRVPSITYRELAELVKTESLVLVDVREVAEYATGNIGGINIPLSTFATRITEIPRDKRIVVYCRSGARSAQAAQMLAAAGYEHVVNLAGGISSVEKH